MTRTAHDHDARTAHDLDREVDAPKQAEAGRLDDSSELRSSADNQVAIAQIIRSAGGALARIRQVAAAAMPSPLAVLDVRAAYRRVDDAIAQLARCGDGPAIAGARADLIAARDAIAPQLGTLLASAERAHGWDADAAPMAGRLGLGPVAIDSGDGARAITDARDARGVAHGTAVHLHPDRVQPGTAAGREVLAHELIHHAQAQQTRTPGDHDQHARDAAELEAADLAPTLAAGGTVAPRRFIDLARPAADHDADLAKAKAGAKPEKGSAAPGTSAIGDGLAGGQDRPGWPQKAEAITVLREWEDPIFKTWLRAIAGGLPPPHPRLPWHAGNSAGMIATEVETQYLMMKGYLGGDSYADRLAKLIYPTDPEALIDNYRSTEPAPAGTPLSNGGRTSGKPIGPTAYSAAAANALAAVGRNVFIESLHRLAARQIAALDAINGPKTTDDDLRKATLGVTTSHPMDLLVAPILAKLARAGATHASKDFDLVPWVDYVSPGRGDKPVAPGPLRPIIEYRWLGDSEPKDPMLWNWIEVQKPADATIEEVADTIYGFRDQYMSQSFNAAFIVASPPYFQIPAEHARRHFPQARSAEPGDKRNLGGDDPAAMLAYSKLGDRIALQQADAAAKAVPPKGAGTGKPKAADPVAMIDTLDKTQIQLEYLNGLIGPWHAADMLTAASLFAEHARTAVLGGGSEVERWGHAIDIQSASLSQVSGELGQLAKALGTPSPGTAAAAVMRAYAKAAGVGHLAGFARPALDQARAAARMLAVSQLDGVVGASRDAVDFQTQIQTSNKTLGNGDIGVDNDHTQLDLDERAARLRAQVIAGSPVDQTEVEEVMLAARETKIRAQCAGTAIQLRALAKGARAADKGFFKQLANTFDDDIHNIPLTAEYLAEGLENLGGGPTYDRKHTIYGGPPETVGERRRAHMREVISIYESRLKQFREEQKIKKFIDDGWKTIERAEFRAVIVEVAAMLAISIAAGQFAGVAAGLVRGIRLGSLISDAVDLYEASKAAQLLGTVTRVAVDVGINSAGQHFVTGDAFGGAVAENLLANVGATVLLKPFHTILHDIKQIEVSGAAKLWKGGAIAIGTGVNMSAELVTGAAVSYVMHRLEHHGEEPPPQTVQGWALQGAALAFGKAIHVAIPQLEHRMTELGQRLGTKIARPFTERVAALNKKSALVQEYGKPEEALEVLTEYRKYLEDEHRLVEDLIKRGPKAVDIHMLKTHLESIEGAQHGVSARAFESMPLRLAGLEEVVPGGNQWRGSTEDIEKAIYQADKLGVKVAVKAKNGRDWVLSYADEEIHIHELPRRGREEPTTARNADDVAHATERAEIARVLEHKWEDATAAQIVGEAGSHGGVIVRDTLQIGSAFAGVVNQHTKGGDPAHTLVIYQFEGTMNHRHGSRIGQTADAHSAPGMSTGAQTTDPGRITSAAFDRAMEIGRFETQTPTARGELVGLERRPADGKDWVGDHPWRATIVVNGQKVKVYCRNLDYAGGMGPTDWSAIDTAHMMPHETFETLRAKGLLVGGDDPDIIKKLRTGSKKTLVLGGSPTGAWSAEDAVRHGVKHVDLVGGLAPFDEWNHLKALEEAAQRGDVAAIDELHKQEEQRSHLGRTLDRNTQEPGAAYNNNDKVHVKVGYPEKMRLTRDGRVEVTFDGGKVEIYEQVFVAYGQDPAAGVGKFLGKSAGDTRETPTATVPAGTIKLKPIYDSTDQLVAIESIDPPGLRLVGATSASPKMASWMDPQYRDKYVKKVNEIAAKNPRFEPGQYTPVGKDSIGVPVSSEAQRERITRANEVWHAENYKMDDGTLIPLDPHKPDLWPGSMESYFTEKFRTQKGRVKVTLVTVEPTGRVFDVMIGPERVGRLKVWTDAGAHVAEHKMNLVLDHAGLTRMKVAEARGSTDGGLAKGGAEASLTDPMGGSLADAAKALPPDPWSHQKGGLDHFQDHETKLGQLGSDAAKVGAALAELHLRYRSTEKMTPAQKGREIDELHALLYDASVKQALPYHHATIAYSIENGTIARFRNADLLATAAHGRASADNFVVGGGEQVTTRSVGEMSKTLHGDHGVSTGWNDVARFQESIEAVPNLSERDRSIVMEKFRESYTKAMQQGGGVQDSTYSQNDAEAFYKVKALLERIKAGDAQAAYRLRKWAGALDPMERAQEILDAARSLGFPS